MSQATLQTTCYKELINITIVEYLSDFQLTRIQCISYEAFALEGKFEIQDITSNEHSQPLLQCDFHSETRNITIFPGTFYNQIEFITEVKT